MKFDGENRLILLEDETVLDVRKMYALWRQWASNIENLKYPLAMRYVGGDKLTDTRLGITYFLMNGWKIKPASKNYTLVVQGNLYSDDGNTPFVNADGDVNVLVINKVSNLIDIVELNGYNNVMTNPSQVAPVAQHIECDTDSDDWVLTQ